MTLTNISESLGLDEESCRELVKLLVDTSSSDMEKMRGGDTAQIKAAAHSIKGASGNLGFTALSAMAADLEKNAGTLEAGDMDKAVSRMREEIGRINDLCR